MKWDTPTLHVADMKPQEFFTELKKATAEDTSLLGSIKDSFMDKFKSLKTPTSCGNCCCDSSDSLDFDRDKDKKRKTRKTRKTRTKTSRTKSLTKSVSKTTSKISSMFDKVKKFVSPVTDFTKKVVGSKVLLKLQKPLGKKASNKVGGTGIALQCLGPNGIGNFTGAYQG